MDIGRINKTTATTKTCGGGEGKRRRMKSILPSQLLEGFDTAVLLLEGREVAGEEDLEEGKGVEMEGSVMILREEGKDVQEEQEEEEKK